MKRALILDIFGDRMVLSMERFFARADTAFLLADVSKTERDFGWSLKINFTELDNNMVDADLEKHKLKSPGKGTTILLIKNIQWRNNNQMCTLKWMRCDKFVP